MKHSSTRTKTKEWNAENETENTGKGAIRERNRERRNPLSVLTIIKAPRSHIMTPQRSAPYSERTLYCATGVIYSRPSFSCDIRVLCPQPDQYCAAQVESLWESNLSSGMQSSSDLSWRSLWSHRCAPWAWAKHSCNTGIVPEQGPGPSQTVSFRSRRIQLGRSMIWSVWRWDLGVVKQVKEGVSMSNRRIW